MALVPFCRQRQLRSQATRKTAVDVSHAGGSGRAWVTQTPKWAFIGGVAAFLGFGDDSEGAGGDLSTKDVDNLKVWQTRVSAKPGFCCNCSGTGTTWNRHGLCGAAGAFNPAPEHVAAAGRLSFAPCSTCCVRVLLVGCRLL